MHAKRSTLVAEAGIHRITPLHRAVFSVGQTADDDDGGVDTSSRAREVLDLLLDRLPPGAVDATAVWGTTAFMLACERGDVTTATKLVEAECDVRKKDAKNQTGLEKATQLGNKEFLADLERNLQGDDLHRTKTRIAWERSRPMVQQRQVRESINIAFERLIFWAHSTDGAAPYSTWIYLAEGGFGKVFLVSNIYPPIEMDGERISKAVVKAAKLSGKGEITKEIEELSRLSHPNIVRILAYSSGVVDNAGSESWVLVTDYCVTDLEKLTVPNKTVREILQCEEYPDMEISTEVLLTLLTEAARGMAYVHGEKKTHLDIKQDVSRP